MANQPPRAPRDTQTRDATVRQATWVSPSLLPDPNPRDGWVHRWIRLSVYGQLDPTNMNTRSREGWVPVLASEYPEIQVMMDENERFKDNVVIGGLILCKAPMELMKARETAHRQLAASQLDAVDNNYMRENDPRMPVLKPERTTRVTFGPRNQES